MIQVYAFKPTALLYVNLRLSHSWYNFRGVEYLMCIYRDTLLPSYIFLSGDFFFSSNNLIVHFERDNQSIFDFLIKLTI